MAAAEPWWKAWSRRGPGPGSRSARWTGLFVIAAASVGFVEALSLLPAWRTAEARSYDYLSTFLAPDRPSEGPVIVAIDEPSMAEIGIRWPWPRDLHARLVESLRKAGARTIALDIIFAEPSDPAADAALAAAMGVDVVLAGDETYLDTPQGLQHIRVEPLADLTRRGARTGVASIGFDRDGVFRRIPAYADGFALEIAWARGKPVQPDGRHLLQVFGPARTYPTVSYYQALDPDAFLPPDTFRGKDVVVGLSLQNAPTTDAAGADAYATSWTVHDGRLVSGAEIQATIHDNLAHGLAVAPAPGWAAVAATLVAALWAAFGVRRGTGWRTVVGSLLAVAVVAAASFLLLRFGRVYAAPLGPSLAFLMVTGAQGARDYAAERRRRRQVTRAFSHYLSPALVERLARDPSQLTLGGEKRVLTILFCDVRGFTTISEALKDDPQRLTSLINRLLTPLSRAILDAGGTIDKYIGDAIMAFWNAPLDDPDHAVHAVDAALAMLTALDRLNAELAAEAEAGGLDPVHLWIGIGINTGECVVGNLGSDTRFDYSALGDAVNLASRLEGKTRDYDVPLLIGPETARLVAPFHDLVEVDRAAVRGRSEVMALTTVASVAAARS